MPGQRHTPRPSPAADPGSWRVLGASVQGSSHEKARKPCQDAHVWRVTPAGILVAAVADGSGSAPLGEAGAQAATRAAADALCERLAGPPPADDTAWHALLAHALGAARAAVEAAAAAHGAPPRDLATTLIALVGTPDLVAAAQVGDGAAVAADAAGNVFPITTPESGEYLNETTFLVSDGALDAPQIRVWRGAVARFAVLSDGIEMLALRMPGGTPHAPFFVPLFRFVAGASDAAQAQEELAAFLRSPRVRERTDDDLTLVLAARIPT